MIRYRSATFWLAIACVGGVAPSLLAAPRIELELGNTPIYVGEACVVTVKVHDFAQEGCPRPTPGEVSNCVIRSIGSASRSEFVQIIGNRRTVTKTWSFSYELTPQRVGELTIPPFEVTVDGQVLRTQPRTVRVRVSDADELMWVEVAVDREKIYVGQRVRATMTIWVVPPTYGRQRLDASTTLRRIEPVDFGPFPLEVTNQNSILRVRTVNGERTTLYAYEFQADFVADRAGPLDFDQITVGMLYPTSAGNRRLRTQPRVAPIEVRPIPMEGRPANFTGAVGVYDLETRATPRSVRVGDPIQLEIDIFGDGPIRTLPAPLLHEYEPLTRHFRVPDETLAGELVNGRRRYTVTIRAVSDEVAEIPPIELPYFDPDAERFVTARSDAIPLDVEPAAEIEAPDLVPEGAEEGGAASVGLEALDGLQDIETRPGALLARSPRVTPRAVSAVMFGPPAIFLATWGGVTIARRRSADPRGRRRQRALSNATRRIQEAGNGSAQERAAAIVAALSGYLADRTGEPPARFVGTASIDYLRARGVSPDVVQQWSDVITRCEEASFGGATPSDASQLEQAAGACLRAVQRERI